MCADTKRHGTVVPGFYDPAFPEVCAGRGNERKVGFTIHSSWPTGSWDQLSMLEDYNRQIADFRDKCNGTLQYSPVPGMNKLCYLTVSQNGAEASPARMRKIGWLKYKGTKAIPPPGGGFVTSAAANSRDREPGRYNFVIERESRDFRLMHARYSFEIEFDQSGEFYTVFFEGCCRPLSLANNKVILCFYLHPILSTFYRVPSHHHRIPECSYAPAGAPVSPFHADVQMIWQADTHSLAGPCVPRAHGSLCQLNAIRTFPDGIVQVHSPPRHDAQARGTRGVRTGVLPTE